MMRVIGAELSERSDGTLGRERFAAKTAAIARQLALIVR